MLVITVIAVATGPFDTFETMPLGARALYWPIAILGISAIMITSVHAVIPKFLPRFQDARAFYVGTLMGSPIASVWLMTVDSLGRDEVFSLVNTLNRWILIMLITVVIGLVKGHITWGWVERLFRASPQPVTDADTDPVASPDAAQAPEAKPQPAPAQEQTRAPEQATAPLPVFFRNLCPELGAELISISTQDHYLDVVTAKGRERILKRLSDALVELDGYPGLQVHRSHWVALDAVDRLEKDGRKARVVLKNGDALPVSRPNLPILTDALSER